MERIYGRVGTNADQVSLSHEMSVLLIGLQDRPSPTGLPFSRMNWPCELWGDGTGPHRVSSATRMMASCSIEL